MASSSSSRPRASRSRPLVRRSGTGRSRLLGSRDPCRAHTGCESMPARAYRPRRPKARRIEHGVPWSNASPLSTIPGPSSVRMSSHVAQITYCLSFDPTCSSNAISLGSVVSRPACCFAFREGRLDGTPASWLHADRAPGRHCGHRRAVCPAAARGPVGSRGLAASAMPEQPEADRPRDAPVSKHLLRVTARQERLLLGNLAGLHLALYRATGPVQRLEFLRHQFARRADEL